MSRLATPLTLHAGIEVPILCGAMYPCSNPELVAAVSEAGGLGVVQPVSLTFVHGMELREGLRYIRTLTARPIGFNALVEASSAAYLDQMRRWVHVALEEGVRFFVTGLGNPRWVSDLVHAAGGVVYHDVTERKWALKALEGGVDGLICVNARAGGHAGALGPERLIEELADLEVPLVCAGGIGSAEEFVRALEMGYAGAQMGTRFIATAECRAHPDYKRAILEAGEDDIVLTERLTGVPVAIIGTPAVLKAGTRAGPIARWMLRGQRTKRAMRALYSLSSVWRLKQASLHGHGYKDFFQAGRSVASIQSILPAGDIVRGFGAAARDGATPG